jgi:hypothetical protein
VPQADKFSEFAKEQDVAKKANNGAKTIAQVN